MNIGFFTDGYLPQLNGVATSVDAWTRELERLGHTVYIIAPKYPGYQDTRKRVIRLTSIRFWKQPEIRLAVYPNPKAILDISKLNLDIIHGLSGGSISTLGLVIAKLKKIPFVFTYYTRWNHYTHYIFNGKLINPNMVQTLSRIFCNRCDYIIAPMAKIKDELISFGVKKPIAVIPSGVDLDQFGKQKKGFLRKITGIKYGEILLHIGRLGEEKRVDFLLESFRLINLKNPAVKLVLMGDGPDKERLKRLSEKLNIKNNVYFVGELNYSKINKVYSDALLFAFASTTETQGMVVLEALASGVPVVAVNDSVFEGIIKSRVNGVLTEDNHENFANSCLEILNDASYRDKLSENARLSMKKLSISNTAKSFEKLYKKLRIQV